MLNFENKAGYDVYDLKKIISLLRSPGGCPWDIEQTHESIRRNLLEEAYEAAEAIDEEDSGHLCEELGDVLMQVIFHADIEERAERFTLDDIADTACKKLIYRHPHVFGSTEVANSTEVLSNWDKLKRAEKNHETVADAMKSVARSLPSLWRAEKVQKKAAKAGYNHADFAEAIEKLREELCELEEAATHGRGIEDELGDVIFSAVSIAGFFNIDPEEAVAASCDKFISRFEHVETAALNADKRIEDLPRAELDILYAQAKQQTNLEN